MWIIVTGNPIDGFSFHGPFSDRNDAIEWAEELDPDWWVVELDTPE